VIRRFFTDPAVRLALRLVLVLRAATLIIAAWGGIVHPAQIDWARQPVFNVIGETITAQGAAYAFVEPWFRWDTGWYAFIAHDGYATNIDSIIFPPLYPTLMRGLAPIFGGDYIVSGLVISTVALFFALVFLFKIVAADENERIARWAVIALALYPASFFLLAAYTESLFLALMLGAWWMVMQKRYWIAGILAFFAALTRSQGWALAIPFGYMVYVAPQNGNWIKAVRYWLTHLIEALRPLPAVLGGLIGTLTYVFGMRLTGLGSVEEQFNSAQWKTALVPPWESLIKAVAALFDPSSQYFSSNVINFAALAFVVVMGILMLRRLKPQYTLFLWVTVLFILLRSYADIQLHGMLRYAVAIFPAFVMLAALLSGQNRAARLWRMVYIGIGIGANIVFLLLFVWWRWIS